MRSCAVVLFVAVSSVQGANPWLGTWDLDGREMTIAGGASSTGAGISIHEVFRKQ